MIKCKQANEADCGKSCCCLVCDTKETCLEKCHFVENKKVTDPMECEFVVVEETSLATFESHAAAIIQTIANISAAKQELENQDKKMREQLEAAMEEYNIKSFENDLVKITYVDPTTRTSVDSAKLKKKYPAVYEECSKTSAVKASVRITVK